LSYWIISTISSKDSATLGITALFFPRDGIGGKDCDLDVGFRYPRGAAASKGGSVRPLKPNMSWVQNGVS